MAWQLWIITALSVVGLGVSLWLCRYVWLSRNYAQENKKLRNLLARVWEQGVSHQCLMEGWYPPIGCDGCKKKTEDEIAKVLKESFFKRIKK